MPEQLPTRDAIRSPDDQSSREAQDQAHHLGRRIVVFQHASLILATASLSFNTRATTCYPAEPHRRNTHRHLGQAVATANGAVVVDSLDSVVHQNPVRKYRW